MKKIFLMMAVFAMSLTFAFGQDFSTDLYNNYDGGYFDNTASDLYDVGDDWYYDNYTLGAQEMEEFGIDTYDWESDIDLFDDDLEVDDTL